jgi:deoxyribodipyrimidine photo-lyase
MSPGTIHWFRRDLRLTDNLGLSAAAAAGPVLPLFISGSGTQAESVLGAASRWWLHRSLEALDSELRARGSRLIIRVGSAAAVLTALARETGATVIHCERLYEPTALAEDAALRNDLAAAGLALEIFDGALLTSPERVRSGEGRPFRVFTPFWRAAQRSLRGGPPLAAPAGFVAPRAWPRSVTLAEVGLLPRVDWTGGLREAWKPGESGGRAALVRFVDDGVLGYAELRDFPGRVGTSRLSPHLHFGELSVRELWHVLASLGGRLNEKAAPGIEAYLRQLGWRDFAYHILYHFPQTKSLALDASMDRFPWAADPALIARWRRGLTGYPIVDAGMRELWHSGWMHNRIRMVVASFLVKDLLCDWRVGAAWFADTLVDADLANNTLGWQWAAGCGADAAPYFRIFNPVLQGQKFDPDGLYVKRWLPELEGLDRRWLHAPWTAPVDVLEQAGVALGRSYPLPIVDHAAARKRALAALASVRGVTATS